MPGEKRLVSVRCRAGYCGVVRRSWRRWRKALLANRRRIQLARAEKRDESRKPARQCLRKCLILAEGLIFQPQAQDDERVGRPVEFAVEARDEPVAPQNRQRVVAELALVLRLVDLPHVVEAK